MVEYDDSKVIAEIDALMEADPSLSRRAAIIQVAGKDSLRRIEKKMERRGEMDLIVPPALIGGVTHRLKAPMSVSDGQVIAVDQDSVIFRPEGGSERRLSVPDLVRVVLPGDRLRVLSDAGVEGRARAVIVENLDSDTKRVNSSLTGLGVPGFLIFLLGAILLLVSLPQTSWSEAAPAYVYGMIVTGFVSWLVAIGMGIRRQRLFVRGLWDLYGGFFPSGKSVKGAATGLDTGAGYDDSATITEVRALMSADPSLSRRAAIIRIAGEDNLRRIEMKMKKEADAALPRISGSFGFLKRHTLTGVPLQREAGRIVKVVEGGFWIALPAGRMFLKFGVWSSRSLSEGMTVTVVRYEDVAVAVKGPRGIVYNEKLVDVRLHYAIAVACVVIPAIFIAIFMPTGMFSSAENPLFQVAMIIPMLAGAIRLMLLVGTGDGRVREEPYSQISELFTA